LGIPQAELTKDERNRAKAVNFGIIYGISAFGLSDNLEISREEAQTYIDTYLARFPHVQDFIQRTIEQATNDGYVTTLLGRRRPILRGVERSDEGEGTAAAQVDEGPDLAGGVEARVPDHQGEPQRRLAVGHQHDEAHVQHRQVSWRRRR